VQHAKTAALEGDDFLVEVVAGGTNALRCVGGPQKSVNRVLGAAILVEKLIVGVDRIERCLEFEVREHETESEFICGDHLDRSSMVLRATAPARERGRLV
jgi:hypothetical protein